MVKANANNDVVWGDLESIGEVINTKDHEGVLTFDSRSKTMYFTKCIKLKNVKMGCAIYTTKKVAKIGQILGLLLLLWIAVHQ